MDDNQNIPVSPRVLVPVEVTKSILHPDLTKPQSRVFTPIKGEYHLCELDGEGNEVPNSDFSINGAAFYAAFSKITCTPDNIVIGSKFLLKKNTQK